MKIQTKVLDKEFYNRKKLGGEYYDVPFYQTFGAAALDLVCTTDVYLHAGTTQCIKTGLAIWIGSSLRSSSRLNISSADEPVGIYQDFGYAGLILPRSGLGSKGLILANTVGLIDEDYQGELLVQVWNRNKEGMVVLEAGDRFAQLMFVPVIKAQLEVVADFNNNTQRGALGFGSTGQ